MYLIIFRGQLIEAFLNDMVTVQILDENDDMKTECHNNGVDLSIISMISLLLTCKLTCRIGNKITCLPTTGQEIDHFLNRSGTVHVE